MTLQNGSLEKTTFHDPCYLGRHNDIYEAPRSVLAQAGMVLLEMDRSKSDSFCCGAGGAQMWKEEEHGSDAVNATRYAEAAATGAGTVAVGCPFCLTMLSDASKQSDDDVVVKEIVEILAERLS